MRKELTGIATLDAIPRIRVILKALPQRQQGRGQIAEDFYARKHPDIALEVFEIPQVPGYRRMSRSNKSVSASLVTTGYAVPIFLWNPYLAGGLFLDYLTRGRFPSVPEHPLVLTLDQLSVLTSSPLDTQNPGSAAGGENSGIGLDPSDQTEIKEDVTSHE